ncbi:DUF3347 domain-containing protein [Ilyomonas limi]|uniref:DUF3347 domain-containing protein n=1 Tax=Ilyomonas limi TaxID=2575867 RepID=A0A4U3L7J5_9BACT|nr:DUF3347 domain-containing protein [Ilyomonas limi]TKK69796.1 DUF3347 domain-containing protein [Ilyomonas limi]
MKKGVIIIVALAVIAAVAYYLFFDDKPQEAQTTAQKQKPVPLAISKNPEAFNVAFGQMMDAYYSLKNDLVNWDSTKAANTATTLKQLVQEVPYDTLQADKNIVLTAKNFSDEIANQSEVLSKANNIEAERRAFNTISENLYSLINTVRYDREVIYHDMCPMAFNETEQAYWLSRDSTISNPYMGNKHPKYKSGMVTCGEVQDAINFASK